MADASNYLESKWAQTLTGVAFSTSALWVQLHIAHPGEAGTVAVAGNTTRVQMVPTATGGVVANATELLWVAVPVSETWTHFSVWDAATGGNCLLLGTLDKPVAVAANADAVFRVGALTATIL